VKTYHVTLPIAGHITVTVEAESKDAAIAKALETDVSSADIDEWTTLKKFNSGNVCHCPSPWEAEVVEDDDE
jgi:hypothetical protein